MSDDTPPITDVPTDRLTGLSNEMLKILQTPENEDVRAIIFLSNETGGGVGMYGYEDSISGIAELFVHMKMVFAANGKQLDFIGIPDSPADLPDGLQ